MSVSADADQRSQVIELVGVFAGRIVDVGSEALTVMVAGTPDTLDDFEELMRALRDRRARNGRVGSRSLSWTKSSVTAVPS